LILVILTLEEIDDHKDAEDLIRSEGDKVVQRDIWNITIRYQLTRKTMSIGWVDDPIYWFSVYVRTWKHFENDYLVVGLEVYWSA